MTKTLAQLDTDVDTLAVSSGPHGKNYLQHDEEDDGVWPGGWSTGESSQYLLGTGREAEDSEYYDTEALDIYADEYYDEGEDSEDDNFDFVSMATLGAEYTEDEMDERVAQFAEVQRKENELRKAR